MGSQTPQSAFTRSSALFDRDGLLLEWDQGFEQEYKTAAKLLRRGVPFRDLLRFLYEHDENAILRVRVEGDAAETERRIGQRLEKVCGETEFEYRNGDGDIVQVRQTLTPS